MGQKALFFFKKSKFICLCLISCEKKIKSQYFFVFLQIKKELETIWN